MAPFEDFPEESIDALVNTQLRGTLNVSRPAWKWMKNNGGGRFLNVEALGNEACADAEFFG